VSVDALEVVAGASGVLLVIAGLVLLLVRRRRAGRATLRQVRIDPQRRDLPPVWAGAWERESPRADVASGPGISFDDLRRRPDERQTGSPRADVASGPGISFDDLRRRPDERQTARVDPRQLLAMQHRERVDAAARPAWRQTGRATVHPTRGDDGDVLVLPGTVLSASREGALRRLVAQETSVRAALGLAADRIDLAWPQEPLLLYDGGVGGYFMPRLDDAYVFSSRKLEPMVRTLMAANGVPDAGVPPIDQPRAVELVHLVATWLRALHVAGVVFGDLGQQSLAFATEPVRIRPLNFDTARVLGRGSLLDSDPEAEFDTAAPTHLSSFDTDRYLFALLAYRLLVSRDRSSAIDPERVSTRLIGLDESTTSQLRRLWQRALGPRGTRPTLDEWVVPLAAPHNAAPS
jgi:hypothetical protein